MEIVVVERVFEEPITADQVRASMGSMEGCLRLHGVRHLDSLLSADGRRMICLFEAPDAESVRIANRTGGAPVERAWSATEHAPPPDVPEP